MYCTNVQLWTITDNNSLHTLVKNLYHGKQRFLNEFIIMVRNLSNIKV